jgi:DnaJ-class molecular chaperone
MGKRTVRWVKCLNCDGSGRYAGKKCGHCDGSGGEWVSHEEDDSGKK